MIWLRKDNPQLKRLVDEFVESHAVGTSFGNTLLRRYLENTKWVKYSTAKHAMDKFRALEAIFRKYGVEYDFDYLMLAARGCQESMLNQNLRGPHGGVGIMQVIPREAAASPINIRNVYDAANNIHAAAKMLRHFADTFFTDPRIDSLNRALFVLASYNAGPTRSLPADHGLIRFQFSLRLIGSTGWNSMLWFQWPFSRMKLLNWAVSDQMLLTGLVSCLLTSERDGSFSSVSAAWIGPALTTEAARSPLDVGCASSPHATPSPAALLRELG
jgi:hypothetical protein